MSQRISIRYDVPLRRYVISMPDHVTLAAIEDLTERFLSALGTHDAEYGLLIDTNKHNFESIACLKALREMLEAPQVATSCLAVAFVAPRQYREPHIASDQEGYFDEVDATHAWLKARMEA
ncbi:hypothetical protein ACFL6C_02885 [Myxococcota bacterium]